MNNEVQLVLFLLVLFVAWKPSLVVDAASSVLRVPIWGLDTLRGLAGYVLAWTVELLKLVLLAGVSVLKYGFGGVVRSLSSALRASGFIIGKIGVAASQMQQVLAIFFVGVFFCWYFELF